MGKSYSSLYTQVIKEINKRAGKEVVTVDSRYSVQPSGEGGSIDSRALAEIITTIASDLADLIEARIIDGFDVVATTPPSKKIKIYNKNRVDSTTVGTATSNGKKWEITSTATDDDGRAYKELQVIDAIPNSYVLYIVVNNDAFTITQSHDDALDDGVEICKIVIPEPGTTAYVVDDQPDNGYDAWVISAKDVVYDEDQEFDDASREKIKDLIGDIIADDLIGSIKLSENLKIVNTQGTIEIDSSALKILSTDQDVLAKFNKDGTFFYNSDGVEIAKFSTDSARVGNIVITTNSIQSGDFVSGVSGFRIKDDGIAEFNDVTVRGAIYASSGEITGSLSIGDTNSIYIRLDGANRYIETSDFVSGALGSGWRISPTDAEFQNIRARGKFSTSLFEKESISIVGGNLLVLDGDILSEDMDSSDAGDTYTKLLLHFNGSDGSTTFIDETGKIITAHGNAQIDTDQSIFEGGCIYFDGASYIDTPTGEDFQFGNENDTIDFIIKFVSLAGLIYFVGHRTDNDNVFYIGVNVNGELAIYLEENNVVRWNVTTSGAGIAINTSYHIALIRNGSSIRVTINGVCPTNGSWTDAGAWPNFTGAFTIGAATNEGSGVGYLTGWIDEFRVSKGIARWTSNFTPPVVTYGTTLTIGGDTSFSVNDILRIKDGFDDEWLKVIDISQSSTYVVSRDMDELYSKDNNPTWKKGTAVVNYKQADDGGAFITSSEAYSPFMDFFTHDGSPWSKTNIKTRIGNLDGVPGCSGSGIYGGAGYLGRLQIIDTISMGSQGSIRSNTIGQYPFLEFSQNGLMLRDNDPGGTYGSGQYGTAVYGYGALGWIFNADLGIPFAMLREPTMSGETVADIRLYNRSSDPTGTAEIGDLAVVNGKLKICTVAGTPGTFIIVGDQTA